MKDRLQCENRVKRGATPAQHIKTRVQFFDLGEVGGERHRVDLHLDVDTRQHARDGNTDTLVVYVAVVGAIERDLETAGVAGLSHQLLGPGQIQRQSLLQIERQPGRSRVRMYDASRCRQPAHHRLL